PRWRPPFITALAAEDRCHLNGLGVVEGQPKYVTALGETDAAGGWRADKPQGGCLIDVPSGEVISRGLSMPHSPRWHDGRLWLRWTCAAARSLPCWSSRPPWKRSSTCNSCAGCDSPRWSDSSKRRSTIRSSCRPPRRQDRHADFRPGETFYLDLFGNSGDSLF